MSTVSLCYFVHNDLPMLKATLAREIQWVDQICILDLASTDGTGDFCKTFLRRQDVYAYRGKNTCPTLGFAEAKNTVISLATMDWICCNGANTIFDWTDLKGIKPWLASAKRDVYSISTVNIKPHKDCNPNLYEEAILEQRLPFIETHRFFVRRGCGVEYRGYIHEEPFIGEMNAAKISRKSPFRRFHFVGWGNDALRQKRYAWMLRNAVENPELQKWTNPWWYKTYWPQHEMELRKLAETY